MSERPTPPSATALIHHAYTAPAGFEAPQVAVHKASTVIFPTVAALHARNWRTKSAYTYGLHGTPTTFTLEERIATLEGGRQALLAPSGLAAITLVNVALLKAGDEVLLPDNVYGPSKELARSLLADWGITHALYDPLDAAALPAQINDRTRLIWLEAPGSVTMEFPDLRELARISRDHGVLSALDNTWGAGLAFCGFDLGGSTTSSAAPLGADIVMQALTKYPSGGGDVLMGSVVTRDEALHLKLLQAHMRLGLGVGANDAELVLRSLASLPLRYHAHDAAAREIASWLGQQRQVQRVLHPALPGSPGHDHWASHCSAAAGLFSVLLDPALTVAQVDAFVDSLKLFRIGYSWGGPVSLVVPYDLRSMRTASDHLPGHLVRFSIGLETVADLIADLERGLKSLN
jgi:cystathionine beta-lyase